MQLTFFSIQRLKRNAFCHFFGNAALTIFFYIVNLRQIRQVLALPLAVACENVSVFTYRLGLYHRSDARKLNFFSGLCDPITVLC